MGRRQFVQNSCSGSAELYIDLASVLRTGFAFDQALGGKAIHQSDRAVVRNLKLLRQFPDRNTLSFGEAFDSQQGLVLARCQPSGSSCFFTELKKLPELVPKGSQYFIFGFRKLREGNSRGNGHCYFDLQYSPAIGMRVNTTPACESSLLARLRLPTARRQRPFLLFPFDILLARLQAKLRRDRKIEEGPVSVKDFYRSPLTRLREVYGGKVGGHVAAGPLASHL